MSPTTQRCRHMDRTAHGAMSADGLMRACGAPMRSGEPVMDPPSGTTSDRLHGTHEPMRAVGRDALGQLRVGRRSSDVPPTARVLTSQAATGGCMTGTPEAAAVDPSIYLRSLRRRWAILLAGCCAGALLPVLLSFGAAPAPVVVDRYYEATHKLIVDPELIEGTGAPNLLQTALFVTGGEVPAVVAEGLDADRDDLTERIRTVTDESVGVIEVAAVADDADEAARLADAFAAGLVDHLDARDRASYRAALDAAAADVARRTRQIRSLDTEIAGIGERVQAIEAAAVSELPSLGVTAADPSALVTERDRERTLNRLRNELGLAETERSARWQLYAEAVAVLDDLEQAGPPRAMLITQDVIDPLEISVGEFDRRLAEGRRGFNNFAVGEVPPPIGSAGPAGPATALPVRTLMGAVAGALLAAALVVVQTRFDRRMRTAADVERCFGVPVLAEIPVARSRNRGRSTPTLHAAVDTRSIVTEAYRRARSAALHQLGAEAAETPHDEREAQVILVTSPGHGDGRTVAAANLATLFAESGLAVLVLDCDHRSPDLHTYFGRRYAPRRALDSGVRGLTLVADAADAAATNPSAVVEAQRELVTRARSRYDLIVVDAAPLLATDDATALLPIADQVLMVVRSGWTERSAAAASADLLYRRGAPVAGVVLTASADAGREPRGRRRDAAQVSAPGRSARGGGFARLMADRRSRGTV